MNHADKNVVVKMKPSFIREGAPFCADTILQKGCDAVVVNQNVCRVNFGLLFVYLIVVNVEVSFGVGHRRVASIKNFPQELEAASRVLLGWCDTGGASSDRTFTWWRSWIDGVG